MIPKIIHACWFGDKSLPDIYKKYIESWKKYNPDFEIKIWYEKDCIELFKGSEYADYCIKNKKYAFLSDVFRLKVLYEYGGIYMDTDVECLKSLSPFLKYDFAIGYIFNSSLGTAILFSSKHNEIPLNILNLTEEQFKLNQRVEVSNNLFTKYFLENVPEFKLNGKNNFIKKANIAVFEKDYFERLVVDKNSFGGYTLHHCDGSWRSKGFKSKIIKPCVKFLLGKKNYEKLISFYLNKKQPYYKFYLEEK